MDFPVITNAICSLSASIFNERLMRGDGEIGGATATQCCPESKSGFIPGNNEAICPSSPKPNTVRLNGSGKLIQSLMDFIDCIKRIVMPGF